MSMKMVFNTCPGHPAYIGTDIKAMGLKFLLQRPDHPTDQFKVLIPLCLGHFYQVAHVPVRGYQHMPGIVGIAVQNDIVFVCPIKNIILDILLLLRLLTQDTTLRFLHQDVLNAPGCPDKLHNNLPMNSFLPILIGGARKRQRAKRSRSSNHPVLSEFRHLPITHAQQLFIDVDIILSRGRGSSNI